MLQLLYIILSLYIHPYARLKFHGKFTLALCAHPQSNIGQATHRIR